MAAKFLQKKPFRLSPAPKIAAVGVIILAIVGVGYYLPFWYIDLGFGTPKYGPYIAYHGENAMMVSWDTTKAQESSLFWGTTFDDLSHEILATEHYWDSNKVSKHHTAIITDLTPGATYYYRVPDISTNVYSFKAAPSVSSGEPVTFMMVADSQGGYHVEKRNIDLMIQNSKDIAFMCIAGDLTNRNDGLSEWAMLFDQKSYGRLASTTPWMNSPGNHENYCIHEGCGYRSYYKTYFQYDYPNGREQLEGMADYGLYYSYNYSNVHMVALDCLENSTLGGYFSDAQLQWLEEDLARNANMWKFVYFHYPMYSMGDFTSEVKMTKILEPIFYKYGVDAVFYGHDHHFESFLVNGTDETYGGTYHFVVGGGGGGIDPLTNTEKYGDRAWPSTTMKVSESDGRFDEIYGHEYQLMGVLTHHFMKVDVDGETATFTAIRTDDGSVIVKYVVQR
jgi:3',5'-cyclic AMP phosphodiesterase CpdA